MSRHDVVEGATFRYPENTDISIDAIRKYRLERVRKQMQQDDVPALIVFDPLNIRYMTDSANMQLWMTHNPSRYALIFAEGPLIMFDYPGTFFLNNQLLMDEVREARSFFSFAAGDRSEEMANKFADEIDELMRKYCGKDRRLGLDRTQHLGTLALVKRGVELLDGMHVMELARRIKSAEEVKAMSHSIASTQIAMRRMHDEMKPGMSEIELWSILHQENISRGGEWIECRLLSSGERTNPWFQEASFRKAKAGDMISYDTDCVGPFGYCADISRAFICGDIAPRPEQKEVYQIAYDHLQRNIEMMEPHISFREYAMRVGSLPPEYACNRYSCCAHGIGLVDEYPCIPYKEDYDAGGGYDGMIEPGMCLCVESYIGHRDGHEGVKLEEQLLIKEDGIELLSSFPFEEELLKS